MPIDPESILAVLDECCASCTFPMLDNGYICLAATRLSLHRSAADWALVIEVFGFSPRAGSPDVGVYTFASRLHRRNRADDYVSVGAFEAYLRNNPHNDLRHFFPLGGSWQDAEDDELLAEDGGSALLRGQAVLPPSLAEYARRGVTLEQPPRVRVFEFCRYLAEVARDRVLATPEERRVSVPPDLTPILQLEAWHHPDLADNDLASDSETFRQLAQVLATGDPGLYRPTQPPNTHWSRWPEGGTL